MKTWCDKEDFKARVMEWANKLGVKTRTVALRPMRNKWASCSTEGNLNFNAKLLGLDREIGDYVIVHELLHFSVPNHGRLWKSLMRAHLGDFELTEAMLEKTSHPLSPANKKPHQEPPAHHTAMRVSVRPYREDLMRLMVKSLLLAKGYPLPRPS